jgi:peptidoglycan biosynthesis protein MviN/MurJ (putative lipid II flippase)
MDGDGQVIVLGLVHGGAATLGSIGLYRRLQRRIGRPIPVLATLGRAAVATAAGAGSAWAVVSLIGWEGRGRALGALVLAGLVGLVAYGAALAALRTPELVALRTRVARRG